MREKIAFKVSTLLILLTIICQSVYLAKSVEPQTHSYSHHSESSITNLNGDVKISKKETVSKNGKTAHYSTFVHKKNGKVEEKRIEGSPKEVKKLKESSKKLKLLGGSKSSQSKQARRKLDHFAELESMHRREMRRFEKHMNLMHKRMMDLDEDFKHLMDFRPKKLHLIDHDFHKEMKSMLRESKSLGKKKNQKSKFYSSSYTESYKNVNGKVEHRVHEEKNNNGKKQDIKKVFRADQTGKVLENKTILNGKPLKDLSLTDDTSEKSGELKSPHLDAAFDGKDGHQEHPAPEASAQAN